MLFVGRQRSRNCRGLTRRAFVEAGASTVLGLSLVDLLRGTAAGAPLEYRGPFQAIPTKVPGVRVGELFPQVARRLDRVALLRAVHTQSNDHGVAGTIGLTGSAASGVGLDGKPLPGAARPTTGSVVARACGGDVNMPPFMVVGGRLHQGKKAIVGEGGGALGGRYDPFRLEYDPATGTRFPALQLPGDLTPERLGDRQRLLEGFGRVRGDAEELTRRLALDDYRAQAFAMLTSPESMKIFDLGRESDAVKDRYGRTRFGQSCLLGRRLVEHGVPFVQVNWSDHVEAEEDAGDGGWDHHYRNFQIMQDRHAPWLDRALAALLDELAERGLLESTLVLAMGEFGRTPKVNASAGRDHWEHCYSVLAAGGGVKGGRVIGSSDARAERPHDRPVTPADLVATVQRAVGIGSELAQTLSVAVDGRPVEELF